MKATVCLRCDSAAGVVAFRLCQEKNRHVLPLLKKLFYGQYQWALPGRHDYQTLPNNPEMAVMRLVGSKHGIMKNREFSKDSPRNDKWRLRKVMWKTFPKVK